MSRRRIGFGTLILTILAILAFLAMTHAIMFDDWRCIIVECRILK